MKLSGCQQAPISEEGVCPDVHSVDCCIFRSHNPIEVVCDMTRTDRRVFKSDDDDMRWLLWTQEGFRSKAGHGLREQRYREDASG